MKNINTTLHHFAYNIKPNKLELVLELFEMLWCRLAYREWEKRWCMIEQKPIPIDIQIIEMNYDIIPIERKNNTHIAFLSKFPKEDIEKIKKWSENKNLKFQHWDWSDKELWFDLPEIFINFVVEIMHTSIVEQ